MVTRRGIQRPVGVIGVLVGLVLAVTGCGGAAEQSDASRSMITVDAANGPVEVPANARRIVSLAPTHTETLFAIGAGDQVVAVDDQSTYPAQAPRTKLSGFKPNVEAIAGYRPDLVVVSGDQDGIVAALGRLGVPVLVEPAAKNIDQAYEQILDLGDAVGKTMEARRVVAGMRSSIEATLAAAPRPARQLSYFHELDPQLFTVTSSTFIGQVYGAFGLRNVADEADTQRSGYPQLSRETLLQTDPDLIFLADAQCCGQGPATVAQRPGWGELRAVRDGGVISLDADITSRWGPRLPDFYRAVGDAVADAARKVPAGR
ncbi:Periplasmic binding protein OS=Tsukamurella paurometabola (strain ATCC 8368 / DSM / CCUG 35730/ CIP 100753 / JCM 10117 / KCTC 9821 / NBRC 16120 / NCIMB 702349 / NCTC 13040) OX=521096 GN=Tpau_1449 PE=4 SV=1 [Tsukamurella paurometabola]|uniref:Periplasmic binding protein n=1 Tax=Tsukamurella paurometabola (strain ATCC 8368 / DSM 20162 / CCUG 35730 / CIP 100753 / JCM 10117 / KCTC 9821 / NBRC 16120 / NCIMB 702349 / NCTC 13040) TaxID=521096 RepID=D5UXI4_TSUPD|nr:ABC transporter substrate-binding protein [Tsukamurella paurometabola]ADG78076.1 periplasmic binding protein [Tsukamurella paurometabola DSM 20162]SUP30074.1 Putative ABC transporter substrate-binding lipoprotein yhfQ precursor [Tsukamurella paurometabola]